MGAEESTSTFFVRLTSRLSWDPLDLHQSKSLCSGTKTNQHEQLFGIVPGKGGGQNCLCDNTVVYFLGKEETHQQNAKKISREGLDSPGIIPGQSHEKIAYVLFCFLALSGTNLSRAKKHINIKKRPTPWRSPIEDPPPRRIRAPLCGYFFLCFIRNALETPRIRWKIFRRCGEGLNRDPEGVALRPKWLQSCFVWRPKSVLCKKKTFPEHQVGLKIGYSVCRGYILLRIADSEENSRSHKFQINDGSCLFFATNRAISGLEKDMT